MRILVVQETGWLERGPHQHHFLFEKISLAGNEVKVIDYPILWRKEGYGIYKKREFPKFSKIYKGADIDVIRPGVIKLPLFCRVSSLFTHFFEIKRQIKEFKPDVIVLYALSTGGIVNQYAKDNKIPVVFHALDIKPSYFNNCLARWFVRAVEKRVYEGCKKVFVLSNALGDYVNSLNVDKKKIKKLNTAVDIKKKTSQSSIDRIKKKYGIKKDDKVMLFIGWLYDFCGLSDVIRSLSEIVSKNKRNKNVKLLIVGDGDNFKNLKSITKELGVENNVVFTGRQPYELMSSFIKASDACLIPFEKNETTQEIVPIKMFEYLAQGKPIITTALGGIKREFGNMKGIHYVKDSFEIPQEFMNMIKKNDFSVSIDIMKEHDIDKVSKDFLSVLESMSK